jgi:hypothetical protein
MRKPFGAMEMFTALIMVMAAQVFIRHVRPIPHFKCAVYYMSITPQEGCPIFQIKEGRV